MSMLEQLRKENSILKNALLRLLEDKHAEVWYEVNKILQVTICESETCDNIFDYVPQKIYCDECRLARTSKVMKND